MTFGQIVWNALFLLVAAAFAGAVLLGLALLIGAVPMLLVAFPLTIGAIALYLLFAWVRHRRRR